MSDAQVELARCYAREQGARAAWFSYAGHAVDMLAKIGLVGPADHLVVYADDFSQKIAESFRWTAVSHVAVSEPAAFLAVSGWGSEEPMAPVFAGRVPAEGSPASYAYPAGRDAARTFWFVSSIGGLGLRVPDLRALAKAAASAGALLIVDNTVPSGFGCRPLALGAHIVLESLDRVAAGALERKAVAVAVAPSVTGRGRKRLVHPEAEDAYRLLCFGLGDPDAPSRATSLSHSDVEAISTGLDTLAARMQRHMDHARALAEYLRCHPQVGHVFYPGLACHPDHELAAQVLQHGAGPALDFSLLGAADETARARHQRFVDSCAAAHRTASAGGAKTRMGVVGRDDLSYIRVFAGTDDPLAIADSLDQALRLFCNPPEP